MKILAIEKEVPGVVAEQFNSMLLKAEAVRVWELHQEGTIRELYFRQDRQDAVLVLECADAKDALKFLGTLPLVEEGLITFEVIPLGAYPGFARLFGDR